MCLHVKQLQLDELYAVLSAVKDGEITTAQAIKRLSRSPHWVWVAMDPVTKLLVALDVHPRVAMQILRHSKIAVTMDVYSQVTSTATQEALRRLGNQLDGPSA